MLLHDARREARSRPGRASSCCSTTRTAPLGRGGDRGGSGAARPGDAGRARRRLPAPGGDRGASMIARRSPEATDWRADRALYGRLAILAPSPVVELNRAVAVAMVDGPGGRPRAPRRARPRRAPRGLSLPPRRARGPAATARAVGAMPRTAYRGRPRADRERGRAGVPPAPAGRDGGRRRPDADRRA